MTAIFISMLIPLLFYLTAYSIQGFFCIYHPLSLPLNCQQAMHRWFIETSLWCDWF